MMKNLKKLVILVTALGVLGTAGTVYAATFKTPAEITSQVTGKSVEAVNEERASGKTYGTIANEAGKLDEFQSQMLEQRKAILDQQVKDGKLTQTQADAIYNNIKNNQATCNGAGMGYGMGAGYGRGAGQGYGRGLGNGYCSGAAVPQGAAAQ
ncbi:DUF2680 domain-containing protein [Desulfitobacterium sp. AusDCA]|uniref:DUF2680 domain-containing protein n=1 Tax=Desulfitobacterium sp. AusDCA TaxID=3240383 RepID=UPI003DA74872